MQTRKQHVLQCAQKLFIENGFANTSIQDILDKAHISKGTFYNYFSSKNACLVAILEEAKREEDMRRQELLAGRDLTDRNVLVQQILVRLHVNKERNLLPIFESIAYSGDAELKSFFQRRHLEELKWLSGRLADLYGENFARFAPDASVLLIGMLQKMLHVWRLGTSETFDPAEFVRYAMRRMDAIARDLIESGDTLFADLIPRDGAGGIADVLPDAEAIARQLDSFCKRLPAGQYEPHAELLRFLTDELGAASPRFALLEAVASSFRSLFKGTPYEQEALKLSSMIWRFCGAGLLRP